MSPRLARKTFATSRLSEFVTEAELTKQIGHGVTDWAQVVANKVIDNAIDEAEDAGLTPRVEVNTKSHMITVVDHGRVSQMRQARDGDPSKSVISTS
jgi:hypothetical protein